MKKLFVAIAVVVMLGGVLGAKEKKAPELTKKQKFTQQIQVLTQKRQKYLQAVQQIEVELIKLEAILGYIEANEDVKEDK